MFNLENFLSSNILIVACFYYNFTHWFVVPLPPSTVKVVPHSTSHNSFTVEFEYNIAETYVEKWKITYGVKGKSNIGSPVTREKYENRYMLNDLTAGQIYTVNVYTVTNDGITSKQPKSIDASVSKLLFFRF